MFSVLVHLYSPATCHRVRAFVCELHNAFHSKSLVIITIIQLNNYQELKWLSTVTSHPLHTENKTY